MKASRRARRGHSLIELLVSLPFAIIAATAAAMLIVQIARVTRTQSALLASVRELRHAHAVLRDDLEPLEPRDLVAVTDSLIEVHAHLGVLQLCEQPTASTVVVAAPARSDDAWVNGVRSGDVVRGYEASSEPAAAPRERTRIVASPPQSVGRGGCGVFNTLVGRRFRLAFADSHPPMAVGTPVLVQRGVRYQYYRSGNHWWLGRRTRDGLVWEGLQPAAGPLLPPTQRGMQAVVIDAQGAPAPPDSAAAVRLLLRTPRRIPLLGTGTATVPADSILMELVLRARISRRLAQ